MFGVLRIPYGLQERVVPAKPAVVTRKLAGGGNRSTRGAVTQQVLASVLRTANQRGLDAGAIVADLLHYSTPTVSAALQSPSQ